MTKKKTGFIEGVILFSLIFLIYLLAGNTMKVMAEEQEGKTVDFVLVLDCSGSMNQSDPWKMSVSAARMFVDLLPVENTRIAVVGFGPDWGEESYVLDYDRETKTLSKAAFPLEHVSSRKEKDQVKNAVSSVVNENRGTSYTSIGYGLLTAIDMLDKGQAKDDSACIVLVSDGRVTETEQTAKKDEYIDKKEKITLFHSIENAIEKAKGRNWPVYCLELNYDNLTPAKSWLRQRAVTQIPRITNGTGGERIEVTSPQDIDAAFAKIFSRFFEVDEFDKEWPKEGVLDHCERFTVEEMTAEINITISGMHTDQVTSLEITDPKGNSKIYTKSETTDSRDIVFEREQYLMAKLIRPMAGEWSVTARGTNGISIKIMVIPVRELNLRLSTQQALEEILPKGKSVDFTASFIYNGGAYSSDRFYVDNPAYLEIVETNEKFPMESGTDNYKGTVVFHDAGQYTVRACVESGYFRNDRKESQEFRFEIENLGIENIGEIPDISMGINDTKDIDCKQYFSSLDDDEMYYQLKVAQTSELAGEFSESGILTLKSGTKAGEFDLVICANDGEMENDAEQPFKVTIGNQPAQILGSEAINIRVSYGKENPPSWLLKVLGVDLTSRAEIKVDEHFKDEDGIPLIYSIEGLSSDSVVEVNDQTEKTGKIFIEGRKRGETTFHIIAVDRSDPSIILDKEIHVESVSMGGYIWEGIKWKVTGLGVVIFVMSALILLTVGGRRIHGIWSVTVDDEFVDEIQLGKLASGKKSKCTLNAILLDLNLPICQSDKIVLKGGNNWTKPVTIVGLGNAEEVDYRNIYYDQIEKKIEKVIMKKKDTLTLKVGGQRITLTRI